METTMLEGMLKHYFTAESGLTNFVYKGDIEAAYKYYSASDSWACDDCLESNNAITAELNKQTYGIWQPYMAYVDKHRQCRTCNEEFIFSKEEQQFWYEKQQFWVVSRAVNCPQCRKDKRVRRNRIKQAQDEIKQFLPKFDKTNIEHVQRIMYLYELTESHKQVQQYAVQLERLKTHLSK
ncbi:MAG: zinc-ribbon domain containing protein [Pseudomonadota bacterium]